MNVFNLKQKNELLTGVRLAAELSSSSPKLRRFITVLGHSLDENNHYIRLSKNLKNLNALQEVYFELRCYEISIEILSEYYENLRDDIDYHLENDIIIDNIKGLDELELKLNDFIDDFAILRPEWHCDNPL